MSRGWLLAVFASLFLAQIGLYWQSFQIKPSGDDFNAPLADIWRAQSDGPIALIVRSAQPHNYRPLQSLAMWSFGSGSDEHRLLRLHLLGFTGMLVFAFAAWLWLCELPASSWAKIGGAAALFAHPTLVAPLAGIDGFSTLFSTGLMWISVYLIWKWREHLTIGIPSALLVFVFALGFKEYALGAVPLACITVLCFGDIRRQAILRCLIVGATFSLVVLAFMLLRRYTIPPPEPGQEIGYLRINPAQWIKNAGLFAGALLFPGSTKWLFLTRTPAVLSIGALSVAGVGLTLLLGLIHRFRFANMKGAPATSTEVRRWTCFAIAGVIGASFPAVLVFHVSEMYVAGMVLPLALAVALAIDGIRHMRPAMAAFSVVVLSTSLIWAGFSVRAKISDLRRMGDRAEHMLQQVLAHIPNDARNLQIAVCYPAASHDEPTYSVFEMRSPLMIEQPQSLWWIRPHCGLFITIPAPSVEQALTERDKYDLVLVWNPQTREFKEH